MKQIETSSHLAEIYVGYKTKPKQKDLPKIKSSQDAYDYLMQVWDENRLEHVEECIILPVNRQNKVLGWAKVSTGGVASTIIDPKILFQIALKSNASAFIMAHNNLS